MPPTTSVASSAGPALVTSLDELPFDNRFTAELPADPERSLRRRQVYGAAFSRVDPTPVSAPRTLAWSTEVAELLNLDPGLCRSPDFAAVFAGNRVPAGADPFAACYGGHQFGSWAGQLGDGRAIALGEVLDRNGGRQTLQLKGAGPTPYSRTADGRAVLRSSLREYLCSEAMAHLGIPTTRALSLVTTGDQVVRDVLYDGHPRPEPGAVVCRVAPSFTRFGTFELPASRGDLGLLRRLVEVTMASDFPHLAGDRSLTFEERLAAFFGEVTERTAALVVDWMRVGFVHGVLNTDNMSILGLTIDYGPYGWLESFDPGWTPNTTDAATRRYRYGAQPQVAHWNLGQLGSALATLTEDPEPLQRALDRFRPAYRQRFERMMVERLGWGAGREGDDVLLDQLFAVLGRTEIDQVLFFRDLARVPLPADPARGPGGEIDAGQTSAGPSGEGSAEIVLAPLAEAWYQPRELVGDVRHALVSWLAAWGRRAAAGGLADVERRRRMDAVNPRFVLRNYLAQEAIDAAEQGDPSLLDELADTLRRPYEEQPGRERFAGRRPEWARHRVGCSMLSCSS